VKNFTIVTPKDHDMQIVFRSKLLEISEDREYCGQNKVSSAKNFQLTMKAELLIKP
jgi:hypothetical protein